MKEEENENKRIDAIDRQIYGICTMYTLYTLFTAHRSTFTAMKNGNLSVNKGYK